MPRSKLSAEQRAALAEQADAERAAVIRRIVDAAPPFTLAQVNVLSRIFEGSAQWMRERAAAKAAERSELPPST